LSVADRDAEAVPSRDVTASGPVIREDTVAALMALGYPKAMAERAVSDAIREEGDRTIEAVLRRSLKRLSR
jgi:Holliday junction DNA helicase RuvA